LNKIIKYFLILAAAYLVFALVAWIFQRQIFLHPRKLAKDFQYKFDIPHQEGFVSPESGISLNTLYFKPDSVSKGIVFYIHGNAHNLSRWGKHAHEFTNRGYEVLMYDFREFGKSNGRLTEANLISDAQYIYDSLKTKYPENKIILYGRSLGTGVAVRLASTNSPKQLILETPYYSLPEVGWSHAPILPYNLLSEFKMPTYQWIRSVKCPIHIFHGTSDQIVPYEHSIRLIEILGKNPNEILTTLPNGRHRGLEKFEEYQIKMNDLLK
jgi:hypothetical protein